MAFTKISDFESPVWNGINGSANDPYAGFRLPTVGQLSKPEFGGTWDGLSGALMAATPDTTKWIAGKRGFGATTHHPIYSNLNPSAGYKDPMEVMGAKWRYEQQLKNMAGGNPNFYGSGQEGFVNKIRALSALQKSRI